MTETNEHRCGWVALMGPPNAGKSTMLNAYLGQKVAIVTPKAQTTRNQISGILTRDDAQVVFLDTPGVHESRGKLHRFMLQSAWSAMSGGDVVLVVLDADLYVRKPHYFETDVNLLLEPIKSAKQPVFVALNKIDQFRDKGQLLPLMEKVSETWPNARVFPVSAKQAAGLGELLEAMVEVLPTAPAMYPEDQIATAPVRFMAAEMIREKLMLKLWQELPYSIAVDIESWEEDPATGVAHIDAVVFVGRKNHKAMVIGKRGQTLKEIGTKARKDIQELLGQKVYLQIWVKIKENWQEDPVFLTDVGLGVDS